MEDKNWLVTFVLVKDDGTKQAERLTVSAPNVTAAIYRALGGRSPGPTTEASQGIFGLEARPV